MNESRAVVILSLSSSLGMRTGEWGWVNGGGR